MFEDLIGFVAGFLVSICLIPQVIKSHKTKKVRDISFLMLLILLIGEILWVIYGILIKSLPIIAMDSFGGFVNLILVFMKMKYKK